MHPDLRLDAHLRPPITQEERMAADNLYARLIAAEEEKLRRQQEAVELTKERIAAFKRIQQENAAPSGKSGK